jgi:hypothetical protein
MKRHRCCRTRSPRARFGRWGRAGHQCDEKQDAATWRQFHHRRVHHRRQEESLRYRPEPLPARYSFVRSRLQVLGVEPIAGANIGMELRTCPKNRDESIRAAQGRSLRLTWTPTYPGVVSLDPYIWGVWAEGTSVERGLSLMWLRETEVGFRGALHPDLAGSLLSVHFGCLCSRPVACDTFAGCQPIS